MSEYALWCLIEGDKVPFPVKILSTLSIGELKDEIKKRATPKLEKLAAMDLILWKLDVDYDDPTINESILNGQYRPLPIPAPNDKPLDAMETISNLWPKPLPNLHIQILVGLPSDIRLHDQYPSKRRRTTDSEAQRDVQFLTDLHRKIWNTEHRELKLFRSVRVTRAHYDELQVRLREKYPERDKPHYNGSKDDVLGVKLDYLRSISSIKSLSLPQPNEDNGQVDGDVNLGASDEGHSEINSLFPFTLNFLDLSTLGLKNCSHRFPLAILVRKDHHDISKLIAEQPERGPGSVMVSGQPGTGKTVDLYLRMIEFMIKGRPFLYQAWDGTVYRVDEHGFQSIWSWEEKKHIVAFIDGDKGDYGPKELLFHHFIQILIATPLRGTNKSWLKQKGNHTHFINLATNLWSPHELFLTGFFLYPYDISFELLSESTSYFGFNPGQCFAAFSASQLTETMSDVMSRIQSVPSDKTMMQLLHSSSTGDQDVSGAIFQISPTKKNDERHLAECVFSAVSPWAYELLLEQYKTAQDDEVTEFYRIILGMPEGGSLRDFVFERHVLKHLDAIKTPSYFLIRKLTTSDEPDSDPMIWVYQGPIPRFAFLDSTVINEITKVVQNRAPRHLVPLTPNFPAVDSILYDPNDADAVLTCIQVTINSEHPIAVSGLRRIQSWLKLDTPLADLRPSTGRPWRFIFIVPLEMASTYKRQRFDGDTGTGEWAEKVDQYVLGMEEATVLRRGKSVISAAQLTLKA